MASNADINAPSAPRAVLRAALTAWLGDRPGSVSIPIEIQPPRDSLHGEYATNLPLRAAKILGRKPMEIASDLAREIRVDGVTSAAAPPGFVNFRISDARWIAEARRIDDAGSECLRSTVGAGRRVHLEFVSANPTGLLHVGHGRGAVLGDALGRVLGEAGFEVHREYYVNDTGHQIDVLGRTIAFEAARALGATPVPLEERYHGDAVEAAGRRLAENETATFLSLPPEEQTRRGAVLGVKEFLEEIRTDLRGIGITFDRWVRETQLHDAGAVRAVEADLRARGWLYEADAPEGAPDRVRRENSKAARTVARQIGGTFLRTTRFGDDEDRILLRKDGTPTYFTADIAYHAQKIRAGFDVLIDIWGQDHASHAGRMRAALRALDLPEGRLEILLVQIVRLLSGGTEVKMSKRSGGAVPLRELVQEAGPDAVRFFYLLNSPDAHFDFDLDLARTRARENPVFYAQYAHARLASILVRGSEAGMFPDPAAAEELGPSEREVLVALARLPEALEDAALARSPHHLAQAILRFAAVWHRYQTQGKENEALRVLRPAAPRTTAARLFLARAAKTAMSAALATLGIARPEVMTR